MPGGSCGASASPTSSTSPRPTATPSSRRPGPVLLEGEAPAGLWDALAAQVAGGRVRSRLGRSLRGANGATNFADRTVTIADQLSHAQAAKTLAHELAHVPLHDGTEYATGYRDRAEVEAESVAYIVCQAAGLTTAAYSFGYVAHWSGGDTASSRPPPNGSSAAPARCSTSSDCSSRLRRDSSPPELQRRLRPARRAEGVQRLVPVAAGNRELGDHEPGSLAPECDRINGLPIEELPGRRGRTSRKAVSVR